MVSTSRLSSHIPPAHADCCASTIYCLCQGVIKSKDALRSEDIESVLESLVHDSHLEMTRPSMHGEDVLYRIMPRLPSIDALASSFTCVPLCGCLTCMGAVQPSDRYVPCPNVTAWLDNAVAATDARR